MGKAPEMAGSENEEKLLHRDTRYGIPGKEWSQIRAERKFRFSLRSAMGFRFRLETTVSRAMWRQFSRRITEPNWISVDT